MASTGAAIISAQGDPTSSVWAFRQTQIDGGGGGGGGITAVNGGTGITATTTSGVVALANTGVTSVVQGSGITVTSTGPGGTGAVTVAATGGGAGVTSIAVAGGGITTSAASGAVTLTTRYVLPTSADGYMKLGTYTVPGAGYPLSLQVFSNQSNDSIDAELQSTTLSVIVGAGAGGSPPTFIGANASYNSALGGGYYIPTVNSPQVPSAFVIATSNFGTILDIYGLFNAFPAGCFYTVNSSASWVNSSTYAGTTPPVGSFQTRTILPVAAASVWSKFPATQDFNLAGNFIRNATSIVSLAGLPLTLEPAVGQSVAFSPGFGNLTPYVAGGRNYLDINAPLVNGVINGALRLIGNSNSVVLTIAATNDLTNINTLNGHELYVYGTFQTTNSSFALNANTSKVIPFSVVIVASSCSLPLGAGQFKMDKSGAYRLILNFSITNAALVGGQFNVALLDTITGVVTNTVRLFTAQPGVSTYTFCATHPSYISNRQLQINIYTYPGTLLSLETEFAANFPTADLNIELMG